MRHHFNQSPQFSVIHDENSDTRVKTSGAPIPQKRVPYETTPTTSRPLSMANGPPESP